MADPVALGRVAAGAALALAGSGVVAAYALTRRVLRSEALALRPPAETVADLGPVGPGIAVVVFGARVWPTGPSAELRARLDHAVNLWHEGVATTVVASGGIDDHVDEVDAMTTYLVGTGVPASAVLPGRPGFNTRATVTTMRRLAEERGLGPFVAVSSPYHARRIEDEARRLGVRLVVSASARGPEMRLPHVRRVRIGTEVVASVWYALPSAWTRSVPAPVRRLRHAVPLALARRGAAGRHAQASLDAVGPG